MGLVGGFNPLPLEVLCSFSCLGSPCPFLAPTHLCPLVPVVLGLLVSLWGCSGDHCLGL